MDFNNVSRGKLFLFGLAAGVLVSIISVIPVINCISCFLGIAILVGAGYLFTSKFDLKNNAIDGLTFTAGYAVVSLAFSMLAVLLGIGISMPGMMTSGADSSDLAIMGGSIVVQIVAMLIGGVVSLVVGTILYLIGAFIRGQTQ